MSIIDRVRIKSRTLFDFYVFQKLGWPAIRAEKISKSLLQQWLPDAPVIVDCGAHDGSDSVELARILGGQVYAFEPVPPIYERLVRRTCGYPNIHCYKLALSDTDGTSTMYVSEGGSDASSSLLKPVEHLKDHPNVSFTSQEQVQHTTLDNWCAQNGVDHVDLLWLDMQGCEIRMLAASPRTLGKVSVIHTEVSTKETYEGAAQLGEMEEFLRARQFEMAIDAIPDGWDMGNVVFRRSTSPSRMKVAFRAFLAAFRARVTFFLLTLGNRFESELSDAPEEVQLVRK